MKDNLISLTLGIFCIIIIPPAVAETQFEDVTEKAGLEYFGRTYGNSWGDFNGDGWADLFTGNHGSLGNGSNLFLNNGDGTFSDIKNQVISEDVFESDLHGAAWADFDNDGDQDIIILVGAEEGRGEGPNIFLINNGDEFLEKAFDYGLESSLSRGRMPLWFDDNNDGLLDILLINWPRIEKSNSTAVYHQTNEGFNKMFDINWFQRLESAHSSTLFYDSRTYILFLNPIPDTIKSENLIIQNIAEKFYLVNIKTSKDLAIQDFNSDLLFDIFVVTGTDANLPFQEDWLLIQTDKHGFKRETFPMSLNSSTSCRSVVAGDFDNDMDVDLYLACSIWGIKNSELNNRDKNLQNILYENLGNGTFIEVLNGWGANSTSFGAAETASIVDYDNDGFLDIFVSNGGGWSEVAEGGPNQLFRNLGNENHWIEIDLVGTVSNRDAIGAVVKISAGGITQIREKTSGVHYHSQDFNRIHAGLGTNSIIEKIEVFWPSGGVNILKNVHADQIIEIVELVSPMLQTRYGIEPAKVQCKDGLELFFKSKNNMPVCVKSSSIIRLVELGWGKEGLN